MNRDRAIVEFRIIKKGFATDLDIPLDITANEFVNAMNTAYKLEIDTENVKNSYLKAENPIALLKGEKTLAEFGIHNGTVILFTE